MMKSMIDLVCLKWDELITTIHCFFVHSTGECYANHSSLILGWTLVFFFFVYSFVWSVISGNASKVDQLWSIVPMIYAWHFFLHEYFINQHFNARMLLVCGLISLWGIRLTYNFWKKGGYGTFFTHEEDHRWPILRAQMSPLVFLLFNLTFIAWYQNVLLFWIATPVYEMTKQSITTITWFDLILTGIFLLLWSIETLADAQHYQFQTYKYSLTPAQRQTHPNVDIQHGYFTQGFFQFSRHPNYFAEQAMWVVIYCFSLETQTSMWNWTLLGAIQLILLFQGSMSFGESITISKYPTYSQYQQITSQCIPHPAILTYLISGNYKIDLQISEKTKKQN